MAGRNINLQISPLPERQRVRKFKTHLKGVTAATDIEHHEEGHDPREDRHDQEDHDHNPENHDGQPAPAAAPAPVQDDKAPKAGDQSAAA